MALTRLEEIQQAYRECRLISDELNDAIATAKLLIADFNLKMAIAMANEEVEMFDYACDSAIVATQKLKRLYEMKRNNSAQMSHHNWCLLQIRELYEQFEKEV